MLRTSSLRPRLSLLKKYFCFRFVSTVNQWSKNKAGTYRIDTNVLYGQLDSSRTGEVNYCGFAARVCKAACTS